MTDILESIINFNKDIMFDNVVFDTQIECYNILFNNTPGNRGREMTTAIKISNI